MDETYDLSLKHPTRWLVSGPSGSGKTTFVEKVLYNMNELFDFYFDNIIYCSGQAFPDFDYVHGIPIHKVKTLKENVLENINSELNNLIIIDDNMNNVVNDIFISDLFTKYSHHRNITVILLVQNLFPKGKYMRDISTNSTYIVLMSNPRELLQIKTLSSQIGGAKNTFIYDAFLDATKNKPFSYLFLDFDQNTPEDVRVRTNIFPNEETFIYKKVLKV